MPSADNEDFQVPQVAAFADALREAVDHAQVVKPTSSIEPGLNKAEFEHLFSQVATIFPSSESKQSDSKRTRQYAIIETAVRDLFSDLVSKVSADSPEFGQVWNLFDILAALSDREKCDPALLFWLVEELLDSQTIEGCRKTFDYLESRRERITAKHFKQKQLVILRTCNELLRRLSRAEDISFCGRVFIFMFQSFPLGDKSSVNLRGEYHTENVTTFEGTPTKSAGDGSDKMEVDAVAESSKEQKSTGGGKAVSFDAKKPLSTDALYPVFWSLQEYFSQPTKLFDAQNLAKFKSGLEATVTAFESVDAQSLKGSKSSDDTKDSSKKRKRFEVESSDNSNFNPKYLTSRDLFELEISDLFFRRHILIQAIIVLDFLMSLSQASKAKYASIKQPNKSVMYSDKMLGEEDSKWADTLRKRINDYIYAGHDGQYVHRIIQSVTARDKGWTRWKIESCPPIVLPSVTPDEFNEARASAKRLATSKKLRPTPMGSLNLDFLKVGKQETDMEKFKDPDRYELPDLSTFKDKIADVDFDLGMARSEKEKAKLVEKKASLTWRALRIASRRKLAAFDKVEDWQNIEAVFQDPADDKEEEKEEEGETGRKPSDMQPIIIAGPNGIGKSSLVKMLLERQPRVFGKMLRHTSRPPKEGEVNGQDFHFVDSVTFNRMLDGDQLIEFTNEDGCDYGTDRKAVESISESGKVPLMQLNREAIEWAKGNLYKARIIFISLSNVDAIANRLKASGYPEEKIPELVKAAKEEIEKSQSGGFYDAVVVNDNLETAYKALEDFIYGPAPDTNGVNGESTSGGADVSMTDVTAPVPETNDIPT